MWFLQKNEDASSQLHLFAFFCIAHIGGFLFFLFLSTIGPISYF